MGFLGIFSRQSTPQKKHPPRGPGKPAKERLERMRVRRLEELRRTDPERYSEIMDSELGLKGKKATIDHETVLAVKDYLHSLGLKIVPAKGGGALDDDSLMSIMRDFAPLIGMLIPQQAQPVQTTATVQPAPQPVAEQAQLPAPQPEQHEVQMSGLSKIIIGQLQNRTPEQAAEWLMAQPIARPVVDAIINSPDEQIPLVLDSIVQQQTDLAGAIEWLRRKPEFLMSMVRAVRYFASGNQEQPKQGQSLGI